MRLPNIEKYRYSFSPHNVPLLTHDTIAEILRSEERNSVVISLDLGLTYIEALITDNQILVDKTRISIDVLKARFPYLKSDTVYAYIDDDLVPLAIHDETTGYFYKLKYLGRGIAPTIEISGIHMHRIEGIDPWTDAKLKVRTLGKLQNSIVLDTCTGLGYTAIIAKKRGARLVVTVEKDANVIELAKFNPWSKELSSENIITLHGDILEVIHAFPERYFTHIIHDPPRINLAGELYSYEFYKELHRVLKPRGKLFHYTGVPGKHSNVSYLKGIKSRLERAGFTEVIWIEEAQGFLAFK